MPPNVPSSSPAATASEPVATHRQRVRFARDEIPRLTGLFGFVAFTELYAAPSVALCHG